MEPTEVEFTFVMYDPIKQWEHWRRDTRFSSQPFHLEHVNNLWYHGTSDILVAFSTMQELENMRNQFSKRSLKFAQI